LFDSESERQAFYKRSGNQKAQTRDELKNAKTLCAPTRQNTHKRKRRAKLNGGAQKIQRTAKRKTR